MFIVKCDAGSNIFFLSAHGWTIERDRALTFSNRGAAHKARQRSYKTNKDRVTIEVA